MVKYETKDRREETKTSTKEQEELLKLIGRTLKKRTECYVVGGTAMMFLNLKETTKDIDIVFKNKEDYENFRETLLYLGAKEPEIKVVDKEKASSILTLGTVRFDLFLDYLIHFKLSDSIIDRVIEVHEFFNLLIKVVSPEDIVLFKSFANREADKVDVVNLLKKININWQIILEEAEKQTKNSEYFFSVFLYDFLQEIREDFNVDIQKEFMRELRKVAEKALLEAEKRLKQKNKNKVKNSKNLHKK